ncbi:MAG: Uncharacterised protein [Synechococcus sp. MIT S9220]|nr:MAG: Uncharacterised protein [Synechococcus sp. MIT S9220]
MQQAIADNQIRWLIRLVNRQQSLVIAKALARQTGCTTAIIRHSNHPVSRIESEH